MFLKKRIDEQIDNLNGVNKLNENLKKRLLNFEMGNSSSRVIDFFTWEEFKEIFITATFMYSFQYGETLFSIFNCGNYAEFWIDGNDKETYQKYENPIQLLNNVRVNEKLLIDIWEFLTVV